MSKVEEPTQSQRPNSRYERVPLAFFICFAFIATSLILRVLNVQIEVNIVQGKAKLKPKSFQEKLTCSAPLPTLFASHPPRPDAPRLQEAAASLHEFLSIRTAASDIDSLSIAVVTPAGPIFEHGYGKRGSVTRDSIYRIASITKMFTVLETLILRERGALSWSGRSCHQISPEFTHPSSGWSDFLRGDSVPANLPITLRQLASHLSGLGRDYPPEDVGEPWPRPLPAGAKEDELQTNSFVPSPNIRWWHLNTVSPSIPTTGFNLLGLCNLAADESATGKERTYSELLQDDVFDPLGLNSSFYEIPNSRLAAQIAVPSSNSELADLSFPVVLQPSGSQYFVTLDFESDSDLYDPGGNLPGYHSQFSINVQWSYGVIVLVSGNYKDTLTLALEAISHFQPAFENLLVQQALKTYGGMWVGDDSMAIVTIEDQALYLQALVVRDQDVLSILQRRPSGESTGIALWSTGRPHEFRLAIGRPELNDNPDAGCEPYWISIDYPMARGAPLDLLLWDSGELVYPSAGVRLRRLTA
ncbi:beta-lactamase/transpeptidase-like protein [Mycena olivaceomarginata]|nr:beta-lactamase/transpeptidase-like protein [Mycena olivaceomarginata]